MDETNETPTVIVEVQPATPTVNEQLVSAGIGIAASLAVPVLLLGAFAIVGTVKQKIDKRRAKKAEAVIETTNE